MNWYPILTREQSSMMDSWTEYLCATEDGDGFALGICAHEILGYIPQEWFDEDGEPLPEYRDENGSLQVPSEYEGREVFGHDGEYLLGPLGQFNEEQSVHVNELCRSALIEALRQMEWSEEDVDEALATLQTLRG